MVLIGHACQDENGSIDGAIVGDQTGKEIRTQEWYKRSGGWGVYLRPLDLEAADKAASFVEEVCANDDFGYSQPDRSSGYRAIIANNGKTAGAKGNFDCSSLCFAAYQYAGLPVGSGYTGNLERLFLATGKFVAHREPEYLDNGAMSQRGGIYLMSGKHVAMVLSNTDESMPDGYDEPEQGSDQASDVQPPYVLTMGRVRVRTGPSTQYAKLLPHSVPDGTKLPYTGIDASNGWHQVETENGIGWISGRVDLTKVVL